MRIRMLGVAGLVAVFLIVLDVPTRSQAPQLSQIQSANRLTWDTRLSDARGPIRTADTRTPLGKTVSSEILGGPANGSDAAYLIYTRMPPGAHGPGSSHYRQIIGTWCCRAR